MDNGVEMPLYNPWAMEWAFCCTTHESWGGYTVVQSMGYGVDILLYNPWSMVRGYPHTYCTTHYPWTINFPWSMGCTTRCTMLHTPCTMRSCHIVSPMYHGEKVAEGAHQRCGQGLCSLTSSRWRSQTHWWRNSAPNLTTTTLVPQQRSS